MRRAAPIVFAILFVPRAAAAQGAADAEPIAVEWNAPATCPSRHWFFGEVQARTPRARAARPEERARTLVVRIDAATDVVGRLSIDDAGTRSTPREIRGATCAEVASALALVAALAVDPQASTAPRPAPPEPPPPPPPPSPSPGPSPAPSPSPSPSPPPSPSPSPSPARSPSSPTDRRLDPRFAVGAAAELAWWSGATPSFRLFGDLSFGDPSIRLAIARSLEVERTASVGGATLAWTTVAADLCPLRFALTDTIALRPCAEIGGGVLSANGVGVREPESRSRPWLFAAAHARLVWAPIRALALEVEGGAMTPFFRESFFFEPGIPVYEAPIAVGFGRFGASVRFP